MVTTFRYRLALASVLVIVAATAVVYAGGVVQPTRADATPLLQATDYPYPGPPPPPGADTGYVPGEIPPDPYASAGALPEIEGGGDVLGSGPAAATIESYLPSFSDPSITQGDGSKAARWIKLGLKVVNPEAARMFGVLNALNGCAQRAGIYAVRGYRQSGTLWGGAIVMFSQRVLQNLPDYLPQCIGLNGDVTGGGPGGLVCNEHYGITTPDDTYYVVIAGLPGSFCADVASGHTAYPHFQWP